MNTLVAIDPGKDKCGLLIADFKRGFVIEGLVVKESEVIDLIIFWREKYHFEMILLGNGTTCKYWLGLLKELAEVQLVEEVGSTLRARKRYWELWPPGKWLSLLPKGLLVPPVYLDAVAALVLLEDYLNQKFIWPGSPDFKIGL